MLLVAVTIVTLDRTVQEGKHRCLEIFDHRLDPFGGSTACYEPGSDPSWDLPVEEWRFWIGTLGGALIAFFSVAAIFPGLAPLARGFARVWRREFTVASLIAGAAALAGMIFHFGSRQFGGFDMSILVDSGYRAFTGQAAYRDFTCFLPPGFFLGVRWAFEIFGVEWNAILAATALFSAMTFVWIFLLMRALDVGRSVAWVTALSVQLAAVVTYSYWWYNSITSVVATVVFLSCLAYLKNDNRAAHSSYIASLALALLMKPNGVGPVIAIGAAALLVAANNKRRVLALTAGAAAVAALFLLVNGINPAAGLASYWTAFRERSQAIAQGWTWPPADSLRAEIMFPLLLAPFAMWWPVFRDSRRRTFVLLLAAAPLMSAAAMFTNRDIKDVDWPLAICAGVLLLHESLTSAAQTALRQNVARVFAGALVALAFMDMSIAASRYRVSLIGPHRFFEWSAPLSSPGPKFFSGMLASPRLRETVERIDRLMQHNSGKVFFGPRLEFAYAAFGVTPPSDIPVWWDPGAAFARADEPRYVEAWRQKHFDTLVFFAGDATYYPAALLKLIEAEYVRDPAFDLISVYRRK